jgi:predicted AAA+ superfamily ATPase
MRIQTQDQLEVHPLRGNIFENFVISEFMKQYFNAGETPPLYFWRDQHGHEIDLVIDSGSGLIPVEIKSGATFHSEWCKNIMWFSNLQPAESKFVIYGGESEFTHHGCTMIPWRNIRSLQN